MKKEENATIKKNGKPHFVSSKKIMSLDGNYNIILGPRSNGKSFGTKNGVVSACFREGCKMALIRRNDLENKDNILQNYFLDCNVEAITNGEYDSIVAWRKDLFFAKYDPDTGKYIKGRQLGRGFSVSAVMHTKSGVYVNYKYAIYEEFVSMSVYLQNEPYLLMQTISSIFRNHDGRVFMVGNTITPLCPYFGEWGLKNIPNMKQPQIDTYTMKNEDGTECIIKVFMTEATDKKSNMFFGHNKEIHGGAFHTDTHDHVEGDIQNANIIYTVVFCCESRKFLAQFMELNGAHFWYISPKTSEIQNNTRTIGDLRTQSDLHTKGLTPISPNEARVFEFFKMGRIRYSDNLTGTLFLQVLQRLRRVDVRFN